MTTNDSSLPPRRRFLAQLSGTLAALAGLPVSAAAARTATDLSDEDHDAWMARAKGKHRQLFHSAGHGDGIGMLMAANYLDVYESAYGFAPAHVSAVIGVHGSALPIALNDAAWNKYELGKRISVNDPTTKEPAKRNIFAVGGPISIDTVIGRGVLLLVCNVALTMTARSLATARSLPEAAVYDDLKASLIPGAILVPGLVVAINRAQEKGFTYVRAS